MLWSDILTSNLIGNQCSPETKIFCWIYSSILIYVHVITQNTKMYRDRVKMHWDLILRDSIIRINANIYALPRYGRMEHPTSILITYGDIFLLHRSDGDLQRKIS